MLAQRTSKWLSKIKKQLFFYRDGYYELPYISNSPDIMLASFKTMPFAKHNPTEKAIYTSNPFTDGVLYYRELEDGFWLTATDIEFKKNVCTKAQYDNGPCDYYFLSHFRYNSAIKEASIHSVELSKAGWSLYKPGTEIMARFNAGDKGVFLNFAFNTAWFTRNVQVENWVDENVIKQYLASNTAYIVWKDIVSSAAGDVQKILAMLKDERANAFNNFTLKMLCMHMMMRFFKSIADMPTNDENNTIKEVDRQQLANVEGMLVATLCTQFQGIDVIAKSVHMSPTKLKTLFKVIYGKSLLQYYQEKQMLMAMELLKNKGTSVKGVALSLGYDNTSNFTLAFKKYHQFLPSDIMQIM